MVLLYGHESHPLRGFWTVETWGLKGPYTRVGSRYKSWWGFTKNQQTQNSYFLECYIELCQQTQGKYSPKWQHTNVGVAGALRVSHSLSHFPSCSRAVSKRWALSCSKTRCLTGNVFSVGESVFWSHGGHFSSKSSTPGSHRAAVPSKGRVGVRRSL